MLPIFRIVAGGGVFFAILILVLALTPPDRARLPLPQRLVAERGPLIDRDEHPEWRQFLMRAALLRANEIDRLRDLPDAPMHVAPEPTPEPPPKAEPTDDAMAPQPKDAPADPSPTGSLPNEAAAAMATAPRAALFTELSVVLPQRRPEAANGHETAKPKPRRPHPRIRKAVAEQPARPMTFLDLLFGPLPNQQPQKPTVHASGRTPAQTAPPNTALLRGSGAVSN